MPTTLTILLFAPIVKSFFNREPNYFESGVTPFPTGNPAVLTFFTTLLQLLVFID
jgi:hypothetical protein